MSETVHIYLKLFEFALIPAVLSAFVYLLKRKNGFGKLPYKVSQLIIGILFGIAAILGTEYGVNIGDAVANARDAAPICAGVLFGAPAGIISGVIGGLWRWFAVAWGAGEYSRIACSVSTAFAGIYAAFLRKVILDNRRPSLILAFVTGGVMEVIHLTVLFLTHLTDPEKAFEIVKICTVPMILCNSVSVLLATFIVSAISTGLHRKERRYKNISQLFQTPMIIAVILAYIVSTMFVFNLQTYSAEQTALGVIELNINDVYQEILDASDKELISTTRSIADEYEKTFAGNSISLKDLAEQFDATDINYINEDGVVIDSLNNLDSTLTENQDESSEFFKLLTGECDKLVQDYKPIASDKNATGKLVGVKLSSGFIQVGYGMTHYRDTVSAQVYGITKNRRIGETGHIIICDKDKNIVSDTSEIDETKFNIADIDIDSNTKLHEKIELTSNDNKYIAEISVVEGYYVIGMMPTSEVYETRNTATYVNSFMEILVFAALFIMIYIIIKKVVVDKLHKINNDLGNIIGGDLDTMVDVHSSDEFASLSDDINSTVSTLKKYIDEASSRIDAELTFAKNIQHSAMPSVFPAFPDRKDFDIFAFMDTAKEVGGDFYDFYLLDSNHMVILIADVSGKGIPAAMFMMTAKSTIKNLAETGIPVNEILTKANEKLCEGNDADMFVTAWMGIIDTKTGNVEFANAGHNPPLLYRSGEGYKYFHSKAGLVLAGMDGFCYKKQEFKLNPGDKILLYTDGITEATDGNKELYREERLEEYLNSNQTLSCEETLMGIKSDVDAFVGSAEQFDDMTMLIFEYKGSNDIKYKEFPAEEDVLADVTDFVSSELESNDVPIKSIMQISVVLEEIFVNIASYAYGDSQGTVLVGCGVENGTVTIVFKDRGMPFDPFSIGDPDITLSAEERQIGGLGIFMTKKIMDQYSYSYENGYNKVVLKKRV